MVIDVITIFPEMFEGILNNSIIKRAIEKESVIINVHDFREFSLEKHKNVDDTTYGGGNGMLIACQPVVDCLKSISGYSDAYKIITSPCGAVWSQEKALSISKKEHIIIVCGHYEGIDDRVNNYIDEEISIGDYVLTGGEIPALAIIDSVVRLIPNVITEGSLIDESFTNGLLEYPQFTKPQVYDGISVPFVLTNGNHEEIRKYRLYESLRKTYKNRPDLIDKLYQEKRIDSEVEFFLEYIKKGLSFEEFDKLKVKKPKKKNNA